MSISPPRPAGTSGTDSTAGAIRITANPPAEAWDAYVRSQPGASLFHGLAWQRVVERAFPSYQPCHRVAWRGDSVCGVLPLYRVPSLPFGCALISTPLAVYGGVCSDPEASTALLADAERYARTIGARYVELRQEQPVPSLATKDLYVTFRCALHEDRNANLMALPHTKRRRIRAAERHGLTHRIGGPELLPEFYALYSENMRDLGSPAFPRRLFAALFEEYGPQCRLFGVFQGDTMVAGSVVFLYRTNIMPYYGGSTRQGMELSANEYMYWNIMCYGAENGFKVFDFGRSKRDSGSYHFKRHWGFTPTPLSYQYQFVGQQEMPDFSPSNPKFAWAIRVWQRMPLPFARWLGPKLSRYFP